MGLFEHFPYTNFQELNLDWLLKHMQELLAVMRELERTVGGFDSRIKELESFMNDLEKGKFPDSFINALYKWMKLNVPEILSEMIKMIWFGLTDSGYFVAYVPESWRDIVFNTTGLDIELAIQPDYGHLVLSSRGDW